MRLISRAVAERERLEKEALQAEVKRLHDRNIQLSIKLKHLEWDLITRHNLRVKLRPEIHKPAKYIVVKA